MNLRKLEKDAYQLAVVLPGIDSSGEFLFAACEDGLHVSDDGGQTWQTAYASLPQALPTFAVALSPDFAHDRMLFAGINGGLLRSADGGKSWTGRHLAAPAPLVSSICVSPHFAQDGIILAGTVEDGIFRSTDHGDHWSPVNIGLLDHNVLSLAVSPHFALDRTCWAGTQSGLFVSRNAGRSWQEVDLPCGHDAVLSLAHRLQDGSLFVGTETQGILIIEGSARRWRKIEHHLHAPVNQIACMDSRDSNPALWVLFGDHLCCSCDDGQTWTEELQKHTVRTFCLAVNGDQRPHVIAAISEPLTLPA